METYSELKQRHQQRMEDFKGIFFAFSEEQFKTGLADLRRETQDFESKIVSIGHGGFVLKSKIKEFEEMLDTNERERKAFKANEKQLIDAIAYELANHEYGYTGDITDALEALDLTIESIPAEVLTKAKKKYRLSASF